MLGLCLTVIQTADAVSRSGGDAGGTVKAALITAAVTLAGIALKDVFLKLRDERRTETLAQEAVYEKYSKPLAAVSLSLLVRLNEILYHPNRPVYLMGVGIPEGPASTFRAYKKISTMYRLASLIGWLRACRREFSHIRLAAQNENKPIYDAIAHFEGALADGSWVEKERIERLVDLWKLDRRNKTSQEDYAGLGTAVDNEIWDCLQSVGVDDCDRLPEDHKKRLCCKVAGLISNSLKTSEVDQSTMNSTWPQAFRILAMKESWLYKDWQDAIGDKMLRRIDGEDRKFDVIGYGEFEESLKSGDENTKRWMARVADIFDGVDLSIEDQFDARPRQIRAISKATADLVLAIHAAQGKQSIFGERSLQIATKMADNKTKSPPAMNVWPSL